MRAVLFRSYRLEKYRVNFNIYEISTTLRRINSAQDNTNTDNLASHQSNVEGLMNDTQQILTIQDADIAPTFRIPYVSQLYDKLTNSMVEKRDHTIKDILCRRRKMGEFTVSTGGTTNDLVKRLDVLNDWLYLDSVFPLVSKYAFFKADFEVTMVFTAAPTTSGGFYALITNDVPLHYLESRTKIRESSMQWPGQQINISQVKETKMTVKWNSPYLGRMPADDTKRGSPGYFELRQLVPVSETVSVVIYLNPIKDTLVASYPSNSWTKPTADLRSLDISYESENVVTASEGTLQSSLQSGKAALLDGIAKISNNLGVTPAIMAGMKTLAALGFSKPISDKPVKNIRLMPSNQLITNDGVYDSHEMGMSNGISIVREEGIFGSKVDECSFEYITGRPNFHSEFKVSTSDSPGKIYINKWVNPFVTTQQPSSTNNWFSHQCLVASQFRHWIGSVIYDIQAYCTQFHSVKLRFTYIPGYMNSYNNLDDCISTVVHFGNNTTHEIICEPTTNVPFRNSYWNTMPSSNVAIDVANCSIGGLVISLESPLQVSNSVAASEISFIMTFHLKDPVFHVPADLNLKLVDPNATVKKRDITYENDIYPTGNIPTQSQSSQMTLISQNLHSGVDHDHLTKIVAGERLLNVKQLMKQFVSPKVIAVDEPASGQKPVFCYNPYRNPLGLSHTADGQNEQDKHDILMSMFTSKRGSWIVMLSQVRNNDPHPVYLLNISNNARFTEQRMYVDYYAVTSSNNSRRTNYIYPDFERNMTIHIPWYCPFSFITENLFPTDLHSKTQNEMYFNHTLMVQTPYRVEEDHKMNFAVSRAIADDFQMGYLCPPLYIDMQDYQNWSSMNDIEFQPPA